MLTKLHNDAFFAKTQDG